MRFEDDGGTPAYRARIRDKRIFVWRFKDLTAFQYVAWFFLFPLIAIPLFFGVSLGLAALTGMPVVSMLLAAAIPLAIIAGRITTPNKTPRNRFSSYR